MTSPPRALVLRALGLGDLLTSVPALRALSHGLSDHRVVIATDRRLGPLLEMAGLDVDLVHAVGLGRFAPEQEAPDVAVNLHGKGPESHRMLLATRPRMLIAFRNDEAGVSGPTWDPHEHEVWRWCRLLEESDIPADPSRIRIHPPVARPASQGVTVLHPGAKAGARRWPLDRWARVAVAEATAGRRVVITGSKEESSLARTLADMAGLDRSAVLAGRTGIEELARVVALADLMVCGDTGVGHLATALGTPSVLLFGPSHPALWGPPPGGPQQVLWKGMLGDPHAPTTDPGLLEITAEEVIEAMERTRETAAYQGEALRRAPHLR